MGISRNENEVSSTRPVVVEKDLIEKPVSTEPGASERPKKPVNLVVHYGLSEDIVAEKVEKLRSKYMLKEIRTIESDKELRDSTPGTYSFISFFDLDIRLRIESPLSTKSHKGNRVPGQFIEVHHHKGGDINLIAFVPESDADRIKKLDGKTEYRVTIAPVLWENFSTLIELPLSRISGSNIRDLNVKYLTGLQVLDLRVK